MVPVISDISHGLHQATQKVACLDVNFLCGCNVQIDREYEIQRDEFPSKDAE